MNNNRTEQSNRENEMAYVVAMAAVPPFAGIETLEAGALARRNVLCEFYPQFRELFRELDLPTKFSERKYL